MFTFRRRTLWIMIYLLIPVIFLLHRAGEDDSPPVEVVAVDHWSLDELQIEHSSNLWRVQLPGAQQWRLTVIQSEAPASELGLGLSDTVQQGMQGGFWLVTIANPATPGSLTEAMSFLSTWLPDGAQRQWVLTGPVTDAMLTTIQQHDPLQGQGQPVPQPPELTANRLTSPPIGSEEQLAFLLWIGVLQQRLGGEASAARWDYRFDTSEVVFNQSLIQDLFEPVSTAEFERVLSTYRESALERRRSAEQIHAYLVVTAVHGLPPDFMLNQPERLAAIDLDAVNQQRERSRREQFNQ